MKTINGNTKLERQINKAKRFMGITLRESSNKYLEVSDYDKDAKYFVVSGTTSKYNEWVIVEPDNSKKDKPYFFKVFGSLQLSDYFDGGLWIVKPYFEQDKKDFAELAKGADDVVTLEHYLTVKTPKVEKN